jgi:hypothetical protein
MAKFLTRLQVEEIDEFAGTWRLLAPLVYRSDVLQRDVTVPAGMVTDFASVPRVLGLYDLEGGRCNAAAVVHDFLYSAGSAYGGVTREQADDVLYEAILASGYGKITAGLFYLAVRAAGASHWQGPNNPQPMNVTAAMEADALMMRAGA